MKIETDKLKKFSQVPKYDIRMENITLYDGEYYTT